MTSVPAPDDPKLKTAFAYVKEVHAWDFKKTCTFFKTDFAKGLTAAQVDEQRTVYGRNELPHDAGTPLWMLVLKQFSDTLVLILIGAALVGVVLAFFEEDEHERVTAFVEPAVIISILIANATVGVLQESSAEKSVEALKAYEAPKATVTRGGQTINIPAADLVPGDVIDVEVGDLVPADCRVLRLDSTAVDCEQAALTGESEPVKKLVEPITKPDCVVQDKQNLAFAGTVCVRGKFRAVVISTGLYTEKGKIASMLKKSDDDDDATPLKKKLDAFGEQLSKAIGIICLLVWAINIRHFWDPAFGGPINGMIYYFKIAVSLAVAAIPEGLPAVVTTCLALGTQRMAKRNAIVTDLPAVETLGCTSVICSDKTGTLTTNQMTVQRFFVLGSAAEIVEFNVEGSSYAPFKDGLQPFDVTPTASSSSLKLTAGTPVRQLAAKLPSVDMTARICALCNDASITYDKGVFAKIGQATEAAMKVLVEKVGNVLPAKDAVLGTAALVNSAAYAAAWNKVMTAEFSRDRKSMGVLVKSTGKGAAASQQQLLVKGAWDSLLGRCTKVLANGEVKPLTEALRAKITAQILSYCTGKEAFRCLTVAYRDISDPDAKRLAAADSADFIKFETEMIFVGVVAIMDPPRPAVPACIATCREAGIDVIVITGDNIDTAVAICRRIGVFGDDEDVKGKAFTGVEFRQMTEKQQLQAVLDARLFARVEPADKKTMVQLLHKHNKIVAMTGDGVNDAPALKAADIGLAMGSGTDVAKGAAKVVLADDDFGTIVAAVEEGRAIFNNTKQFCRYLISANIGEVVAIFLVAVTGLPEVLLPVQLLWVNLVTDGLPAVALGFNPPEEGIMKQPPRPHDDPIVDAWSLFRFFVNGTYIGLATVAGSVWWFMFYEAGPKLSWTQLFQWSRCGADTVPCSIFDDFSSNTMSLSVLVTIEMGMALNSLSDRQSLFSRTGHPLTNPKLLVAMSISFALHFVILYVPFLARIFQVEPLNLIEWQMVLLLSAPIILVDELLKLSMRMFGFGLRRSPKPQAPARAVAAGASDAAKKKRK